MKLTASGLTCVNTTALDAQVKGESAVRVVKADKLMEFDTNSYARLDGVHMKNGTIRVKMLSRLLDDAPDFARGFIGIAFRIDDADASFESFYVRPTNAHVDDPVRRAHGGQYFAYPTYTFSWFRDRGVTAYECETETGLDEWMTLTCRLRGDRAEFYLNDEAAPRLTVDPLLHGEGSGDGVGLFVDIGTEGFFRDIEIIPD
ncbi:MAG: hypothetical protein E7317_06365 [Clostridiales bacterium]|nr:hypothetical protein [Clostridiales bacterium]